MIDAAGVVPHCWEEDPTMTEVGSSPQRSTDGYWLTRFVMLRLLGFVYAVAFLVAAKQILPLIGSHGLLPVDLFLEQVGKSLGSPAAGFVRLPSLFWFAHSDTILKLSAWFGFALACLVVAGYANAIVMAVLWALYMSFVHVGQDWYGYGWEIQLLETGFLAIFLCPLLDGRPFPKHAPPAVVLWLFRWLIFRIMVGAALIKLRGDSCWRDLTALYYHFETQPIPSPLSRWFDFLPHWILKAGVLFNFLAELIAPWFAFYPRIAGASRGDHRGVSIHADPRRQPFVSELADHRPGAGMFRRRFLGEAAAAKSGESRDHRRSLRATKPADAKRRVDGCRGGRSVESLARGQHDFAAAGHEHVV